MQIRYFLAASVASVSMACSLATPAMAQQITSGIQGSVSDDEGNPLSGATITITDSRTGASRTTTSSEDGSFRATSLVTGGPYTVSAEAPGFEGQTVENVTINLQGATRFNFQLSMDSSENLIVVTGARANVSQLAIGPGQSFSQETLEAFPSITRDIRDTIRIDPRVSLDRSNEVDRISCLGGNDRSNTFTIDGIVQADSFGLNGTPFAARNAMPIPFDAIRETSVEFAPFDVEYGQFSGCAINVVTKSGQNDFHGTAFFTFRNEDLRGDKLDGRDFIPAAFDEYRWGATLSGPIFKDKLFFFFGYEETDLGDSQDTGPSGAGFANELSFINQAQFDEISGILQNVYGVDTGGIARALPESSRRFFGRLDWYINDDHRLEATYQRLEETNVEGDDFFGFERVSGLNSFEDEGTESDYYAVRLYSQWTDNLSTEIRLSSSDVTDIQGPVGGGEAQDANPINRFAIFVENPTDPTEFGTFFAGPGIFRSANALQQEIDQLKIKADLVQGNHTLSLGGEVNQLDVYNLFAVNGTGTLFFASVDDLREGLISAGNGGFGNPFAVGSDIGNQTVAGAVISATPSGDINEAAARFRRTIFSIYGQDKWQVNDSLSLIAGLRIDWYDGDAPRGNPEFLRRYGFTNKNPFSHIDPVVQPRLGMTYDFNNEGVLSDSQLTGGFGIFAGGDPTVWFSNAFSNNGFSTGQGQTTDAACAGLPRNAAGQIDVTPGGTFTGIPGCAITAASAQAAAGLADTQSTDPDLEIPTVLRFNLGFNTLVNFSGGNGFFDNWRVRLDYIYSRFEDPFNFVDLSQVVNPALGLNGYTVDGRPIYRAIDPTAAGCNAVLQGNGGTPPTYTNVTAACFNTRRDDELQLTNTGGYDTHVASFGLSKYFNGGLLTDGGSTTFSFGYAFTDSENRRNLGSSTSTSNYDVTAAFDRQNPAVSTSNFQTRHNFTLATNFKEEFFGDYATELGLIFVARSGRPYSLTFDGGGVFNDSASGEDNALLYIPTGVSDPNVSPLSDAAAVAALDNYVSGLKCADEARGTTIARNTCRQDWFFDLDLRFSQELPGPGRFFGLEDKIQFFVDFDNFLNLIDNGANLFKTQQEFTDLVDGGVDNQGRYIISGFNPDDQELIGISSSAWKIQLGVRYEF